MARKVVALLVFSGGILTLVSLVYAVFEWMPESIRKHPATLVVACALTLGLYLLWDNWSERLFNKASVKR